MSRLIALFFPLLALMMALALSGCATHAPQAVQPPPGLPEAFAGNAAFQELTIRPDTGPWWLVFADEQLNTLMHELFASNFSLAGAQARLERARAAVDAAQAARVPMLNLEAGGGRQRQITLPGPQTRDSYRLSAAAAYEIDLWGKLAAREQAAAEEADAVREDVRAMYLSLSATLADVYYLAAEAKAQIELTDLATIQGEHILELTQRRYQEGLVPLLDVHQARQNLARVKAQRPAHEARLGQAQNALAVLLGRYPGSIGHVAAPALPQAPDVFAAGLPAELLTNRPDIRAAQRRLQAADARIAAAVADRFPSFSLSAAYGGASTDLGLLLSSGNLFWSLLLNAAQPLLDGGRREAEMRRSQAEFEELLARYHQTVLQAFAEVEDALTQNETTTRRISLLEDQRQTVAHTLETALWRYRQGLSGYLPVLQAQTSLVDAEVALLAARRQILAERVQLARVLGGNWMDDLTEDR